ncbi:MAG: hypothetical protein KGK08_06940 [Acidobacteriota bacterium]|nr:hypothetical protein [Acidobacteriota bacterium]
MAGMTAVMRKVLAVERLLRPGTPKPPAAVRSVLVLEYMLPLGCCVHLTPVFAALKGDRPELQIVVATRGLGSAVLRHNPHVDALIETPDPLSDLPGAVRALRARLKQRGLQPECVLTGCSDQRTRIALLALLAVPVWRGGFTQAPELYARPLQRDPQQSLIGNNLRLAQMLGSRSHAREPELYYAAADAARAQALLRDANPHQLPVTVLVTQNSGGQRTGWHDERWVQVIRYAVEVLGHAVVYVGTAADSAAIEQLRAAAGGLGSSLAGQTSVAELAALLAAADMAVALDTGTMHVGRAVGLPMVVLGPSWQRPLEWLPLGLPQVRILRGEDRDGGAPEGYRLDEIRAEDVCHAMAELAQVYPASATAREQRLKRWISTTDPLR